jgi:hypothetical protein
VSLWFILFCAPKTPTFKTHYREIGALLLAASANIRN